MKLNLVEQHQFKMTKSILSTEQTLTVQMRLDYDFQNFRFFVCNYCRANLSHPTCSYNRWQLNIMVSSGTKLSRVSPQIGKKKY